MENKQPLVSVNVLMYNSSKYIIETLESIKAQTYQNIELIISDDKSTDNTVQLCEEWISKNKERFVGYKILVPEANTGQSGNYNRAFRAATGEWIKEIDGDDLLLPNCLTDLVEYVNENPEAKYVFGRMVGFGDDQSCIDSILNRFDYSFFNKTQAEKLEQLIFRSNCVPSPTSFYNRMYVESLGFENDERIPYLEDWPKWINLLKNGVVFHHLPNDIVAYRVDSGISTGYPSEKYYHTYVLFRALYCYPEWYSKNLLDGALKIAENELSLFKQSKQYREDLENIINSKSYIIGNILAMPFRFFKKIINR